MIHPLAKIVLGPLMLVQGKRVRRKALKLPEPPGERRGTVGQGPLVRLLLAGDSAAAGVGADTQDEALLGNILTGLQDDFEVNYRLIAKTGATTASTIKRLARLEPVTYDVAITSLGVNDVTSGRSVVDWLKEQRELIQLFRDHYSAKQVILSGLPPMSCFPLLPQPLRWYLGEQARRFDRGLRQLADERGCDYISLDVTKDQSLIAADGFHPGPKVYELWGKEVANRIVNRQARIPRSS